MADTESLVPREAFSQEIIQEASRSPYVPTKHNGKQNPYTGGKITNEQEYYEYQREYVYHRLCEEILRIQYDQKLDARVHTYTQVYEKDLHRHKVFSRVRFLTLLLALAFVLFHYLPDQKELAFQKGQTDGYDTGYENGYDSGQDEGYDSGYQEGFDFGYDIGYQRAKLTGSSQGTNNTSGRFQLQEKNNSSVGDINSNFTVYVSQNGHKIHKKPDCSGMKYYDIMSYSSAVAAGYSHCSKCF